MPLPAETATASLLKRTATRGRIVLDSLHPAPVAAGPTWPDAERLRWIEQPRIEAPGLDSLLTWAFNVGASRIAFQTGHPIWVRIHGQNYRVTKRPMDELDFSQIVNHLYGADGMAPAAGRHGFRHCLCHCDLARGASALPLECDADTDIPPRWRQHRAPTDRRPAALVGTAGCRADDPRQLPTARGHDPGDGGDRVGKVHADCRADKGQARGPDRELRHRRGRGAGRVPHGAVFAVRPRP